MTDTKVFILDNQDSFTYNLVEEFYNLGYQPIVYRNTLSAEFILAQINVQCQQDNAKPLLVLSPGPGNPGSAGCLMALLDQCVGTMPILGICLGHQALIQHYGGTVGRAPEIMHGKASNVSHQQCGAFAAMPNPLPVARYHSLVATKMPAVLSTIAEYQGLVMAVEQQQDATLGLQFHPESILTSQGSQLLAQCIEHLLTLAQRPETTSSPQQKTGADREQ